MRKRVYVFRPPSYTAFPQTCKQCNCCGHNLTAHNAWLALWPELKGDYSLSWPVHESGIHHGCVWCRYWHWFGPRLAERTRLAAYHQPAAQGCTSNP